MMKPVSADGKMSQCFCEVCSGAGRILSWDGAEYVLCPNCVGPFLWGSSEQEVYHACWVAFAEEGMLSLGARLMSESRASWEGSPDVRAF